VRECVAVLVPIPAPLAPIDESEVDFVDSVRNLRQSCITHVDIWCNIVTLSY
jgi:hypothetical protein